MLRLPIKAGAKAFKIIFYLWLTLPGNGIIAQGLESSLKAVTLEDGLSQSSVVCMAQDEMGFMWFGTQDGLNRYDGYEMRVFREGDGNLSDGLINALARGSNGSIWVGTSKGLDRYNPLTGAFDSFHSQAGHVRSLSNQWIECLYQDRTGVLWIGTKNGLSRYEESSGAFESFTHEDANPKSLSHNRVYCIFQDKNNVIWVGTENGLNQWENGSFRHYFHDPENPNSLGGNHIKSLAEDASGSLWMAVVGGGLNRLSPDRNHITRYEHNPENTNSLHSNWAWSIMVDKAQNVWVGAQERGLCRYLPEEDLFQRFKPDMRNPVTLGMNKIFSIYEDRTGLIWIGTDISGLKIFDPNAGVFSHYQQRIEEGVTDHAVYAIVEDSDQKLWIGSEYNGLLSISDSGNFGADPAVPEILQKGWVMTIQEGKDGTLWVGTEEGLYAYDGGEAIHYEPHPEGRANHRHNSVSSLLMTHDQKMWVATRGRGLCRFNLIAREFEHFGVQPQDPEGLNHYEVRSLYEDKRDILWIGTFGGGLNFRLPSGEMGYFTYDPNKAGHISSDRVLMVTGDPEDERLLWVGTSGGGLNRLVLADDFMESRKAVFTTWRTEDGLPNDEIYAVVPDDESYLWLSTNRGLSRFHPQKETFKNFDVRDGLQSNEFNRGSYYKKENGQLFFGGINGLTVFHPKDIKENTIPPQVVITQLRIANKIVSPGALIDDRTPLEIEITRAEKAVLSYNDNFMLTFAGLHYSESSKNRYAYKLEGIDPEWVYVGATNRNASYTTLPPRTYQFRVKAASKNGIWSEGEARLSITIQPPLWRTWWAYGVYFLMVFAIIWFYLRTQKKIQQHLEHQVTIKTGELKAKNTELVEAQKEMVRLAHSAGMAESATHALHHMGNALNSVKTSVHTVGEIMGESKDRDILVRVTALMKDQPDLGRFFSNDEKSHNVLPLLEKVSGRLTRRDAQMEEEVKRLEEQVIRLTSTLRDQWKHAELTDKIKEETNLNQLLEMMMNQESEVFKEWGIQVHCSFGTLDAISVDAFKLERILRHLLQNAREAIGKRKNGQEGRIWLETEQSQDKIRVRVRDNGVGIAPQHKPLLFQSGFTTKKSDASGQGLHYCANAVYEMGGVIGMDNLTTGQGVLVEIELPLT